MAYFPAFLKLDNVKILIVGGGNIASEKLEHLLDFTNDITIIAPKLNDNMSKMIQDNNLKFQKRKYESSDINGYKIIIVAVDDISLQETIFNQAKTIPNCLVNSVDSVDYCDFIFPSYIKKDDLTIAVSTSGSSPAIAKHLRRYLENLIPNSIGEFLNKMKEYRKTMPKGKERMEFLDKKAKEYIDSWK
jgi:precorrin-2 dehydrogenase/sirohydrochlorin ferrochelatase